MELGTFTSPSFGQQEVLVSWGLSLGDIPSISTCEDVENDGRKQPVKDIMHVLQEHRDRE